MDGMDVIVACSQAGACCQLPQFCPRLPVAWCACCCWLLACVLCTVNGCQRRSVACFPPRRVPGVPPTRGVRPPVMRSRPPWCCRTRTAA
jgi:hypothetical protein